MELTNKELLILKNLCYKYGCDCAVLGHKDLAKWYANLGKKLETQLKEQKKC